MLNNNGSSTIQTKTTNFQNNLPDINNTDNFTKSNDILKIESNQKQDFLNQKRSRPDDISYDMAKNESNMSSFIRPVDTYSQPSSANNFIKGFNGINDNKKSNKTNYYDSNTKIETHSNNESSINEHSIAEISESDKKTGINTEYASMNDHYPKLQNIVSTVNLKCKLDLREIALKARNAEYNPKRFAAVIMRIREPKTTALIFASGKMVCTGARSEEDSKKAARQYAKIIHKLNFDVKFTEFTIQNIVGSCDVKFPIRLEGLAASDNSKFCSYEPEMFPGLIYRMHAPKIVLLIFVSGKIVLTGAKNRNDIFKAYEIILPILNCYKKKETQSSTNVITP